MRRQCSADLSKAKRYFTLAGKERRRTDRLKWHDKAMAELRSALGWPQKNDNPQGRLV